MSDNQICHAEEWVIAAGDYPYKNLKEMYREGPCQQASCNKKLCAKGAKESPNHMSYKWEQPKYTGVGIS